MSDPSSPSWLTRLGRELELGTSTFPTIHPAPRALRAELRPGLVRLTEPTRELAESHEDVARDLGWPPGGWCE